MMRCAILSLVAVLTLSTAASAQEAAAPAGQKTVQATKVFRYWDKFLEAPADHRNRLRISFFLRKDGRPATGYHPVLIDGDRKIPLPLGPDGRFQRLPTLEEMRDKPLFSIDAPPETKFSGVIQIESTARAGQEVDAKEVQASIRQVGAVLRDTVGALAILAPAVKATFPGATSGVAVTASGAEKPLGKGPLGPVYDPGVQKDAVKLRFARAPSSIQLMLGD